MNSNSKSKTQTERLFSHLAVATTSKVKKAALESVKLNGCTYLAPDVLLPAQPTDQDCHHCAHARIKSIKDKVATDALLLAIENYIVPSLCQDRCLVVFSYRGHYISASSEELTSAAGEYTVTFPKEYLVDPSDYDTVTVGSRVAEVFNTAADDWSLAVGNKISRVEQIAMTLRLAISRLDQLFVTYRKTYDKYGVTFYDVTPYISLAAHRQAYLTACMARLVARIPELGQMLIESDASDATASTSASITVIGVESRGFLLGTLLANSLNCNFALIRKQGKLPGTTISASYQKEYGSDIVEIQEDALEGTTLAIVIDDVLATGGTLKACMDLARQAGASKVYALVMDRVTALDQTAREVLGSDYDAVI